MPSPAGRKLYAAPCDAAPSNACSFRPTIAFLCDSEVTHNERASFKSTAGIDAVEVWRLSFI